MADKKRMHGCPVTRQERGTEKVRGKKKISRSQVKGEGTKRAGHTRPARPLKKVEEAPPRGGNLPRYNRTSRPGVKNL